MLWDITYCLQKIVSQGIHLLQVAPGQCQPNRHHWRQAEVLWHWSCVPPADTVVIRTVLGTWSPPVVPAKTTPCSRASVKRMTNIQSDMLTWGDKINTFSSSAVFNGKYSLFHANSMRITLLNNSQYCEVCYKIMLKWDWVIMLI